MTQKQRHTCKRRMFAPPSEGASALEPPSVKDRVRRLGELASVGPLPPAFFRRVEVIKWIFIDINGKYVTSPYVQNCSKPYCGYYGDFMGILIPANWNHNLDKNVSNWGC